MSTQVPALLRAMAITGSLAALAAPAAQAVPLLEFEGTDSVYGELALQSNDDGFSNELDLPFELNFYGNRFDSFFVNNNGSVSFNDGVSAYTPEPFPTSSQPMIAPFWGDVDTRCEGCGNVYVGTPNQAPG